MDVAKIGSARIGFATPRQSLAPTPSSGYSERYERKTAPTTSVGRAKAQLLECFCPRSLVWRRAVITQGLSLIERAIVAGVRSHHPEDRTPPAGLECRVASPGSEGTMSRCNQMPRQSLSISRA